MPRQSIQPDGSIRYRTRLLTPDQARRFERCLRANDSRFTDIEFCFKDQARGERFCFISYRPVNNDRIHDAYARERDKRDAKAADEGRFYLWALDTDGPRPFYHCASLSGETYEVTHSTCTCPDHQFRCGPAASYYVRCKHRVALELAVQSGELPGVEETLALWRVAQPRAGRWAVPAVVEVPVNSNDADTFAEPVYAGHHELPAHLRDDWA